MDRKTQEQDEVRGKVRAGYAEIATRGTTLGSGGCCGPQVSCCGTGSLAERIGYSGDELADLPAGADMGLSCGNPTAIASLKPGEVVLDLGSGGGFDCFIAGPRVGPSGQVIGVDMTPEMLSKARGNARSTWSVPVLRTLSFAWEKSNIYRSRIAASTW
jgi:hypothetical protein